MAIQLKKGQKINLSKEKKGLSRVIVGLGWDEAKPKSNGGFLSGLISFFTTSTIDCDAFAILLENGRFTYDDDKVYFGNLRHNSGAVRHMGDNLTGGGDGDDEQIEIDLARLPKNYDRIIIGVNIYNAVNKKQHFGMIQNAFIRIVDASNNTEICKFRLAENYENMTSLIFGELYIDNGEWQFNALGDATQDENIADVAERFR